MRSIGIALSGGGHRASVFALGALIYLVDSGRHRDVRSIASVSGGSLTNAYFAALQKPYNELTAEEFESAAADLAKLFAGRPEWWSAAWIVYLVPFAFWVSQVPSLVRFENGWWKSQLGFVLLVLLWAALIGPRSLGTFWGWWGTWAYCGFLVPVVIIAVIIWFQPLHWGWPMIATLLAMVYVGARSGLAALSFGATICAHPSAREHARARGTGMLLAHMHNRIRHIVCATEMHGGRHAYFSHDLVFNPDQGLGDPSAMRLRTAVQASANFPGAFPFRILDLGKHHFIPGNRAQWAMILSDGGVSDNTATSWYLDADERRKKMKWTVYDSDAAALRSEYRLHEDRLRKQMEAMDETTDQLIAINSSAVRIWKRMGTVFGLPVLGELLGVLKLPDTMYNNVGRQHLRMLRQLCVEGTLGGVVVSIEDSPLALVRFLANPNDSVQKWRQLIVQAAPGALGRHRENAENAIAQVKRDLPQPGLDAYESEDHLRVLSARLRVEMEQKSAELTSLPPDSHEEQEKVKAELYGLAWKLALAKSELPSIERDERRREATFSQETWKMDQMAENNSKVPTTFRPLGSKVVANLLYHAYLLTMMDSHVLLEGFPLFREWPRFEDFERLAQGLPRELHPRDRAAA
jgi:predicted acylesterase/phospholipase RssA